MNSSAFDLSPETPESPKLDEGKLKRILEGDARTFPGNCSLMQYFQVAFSEGKILPDNAALIEEEKHHTFRELDEISTRLAVVIRNNLGGDKITTENPDSDIVIGICIPPSEKLIFTIFAILKLGAAYLPFDNSFPEDRVVKIVEGARPVMIISDPHNHTISKFDPVIRDTKVVSVEYLLELAGYEDPEDVSSGVGAEVFPGPMNLSERIAIVLYTSGSSGEPKGVRLSHRIIMNRLHWQWKTFPYTVDEKCCFKTALTFVDSVPEIFGPLLTGHSVTIYGKMITTHPNLLIQRIHDDKITRIVLVPSLLRAILHTVEFIGVVEGGELLSSMALWVCSGETLPKNLLQIFFEKFPTGAVLCNFYGSTEIMGDVTYETFTSINDVQDKSDESHVPIGRSIFNTIVYILNEDMEVVPEGETGEIYIAGYNLATGYVGIPNSPKFLDNPFTTTIGFNKLFRTGDFGRIGKPGLGIRTLFYEGRIDSQIKIRGFRIDLSEMESIILSKSELVDKAVVLCYHPGGEDQTLVAFVIPKEDVSEGRIDMMLKLKFRPYEVPELRIVSEIPLLVNGKVDRQRLLTSYEEEKTSANSFDNWHLLKIPEDQLKPMQIFVQTMSEVTGTSQHTIVKDLDDSFFNLGGNSLNSITVIMKLREKGYQIPISDFLKAKSIREIVSRMELLSAIVDGTSVSSEAKKAYFTEKLTEDHYEDAVAIIAYSFSHRGDLEAYTHAEYNDFVRLMHSVWEDLLIKGCSFVIRRKETKQMIAVALNFDAYDEPKRINAAEGIKYVLDFLEMIETKQKQKLPKGKKKLWHSFMMGTHEDVDEGENVTLAIHMEEENIRLARLAKFIGILTTNTSPLTQQICQELQGYEVLMDYQVNTYEAPDGTKPFHLAPDSQRAVCCWKKLDHLEAPFSHHSDN